MALNKMDANQTAQNSKKAKPVTAPLIGEYTAIRPVAASDLPFLQAWDNDPDIIALMGQKFVDMTVEQWFDGLPSWRQTRAFVIETGDGRLIGELELAQLNWRNGSAEIRICIGEKDCWSQGYGSDALRSALRLAFEGYGLRAVYLRVFTSNARAIRAYERVGFRTQGVLPPSERRNDPSSVRLMSLSRERWNRVQAQTA